MKFDRTITKTKILIFDESPLMRKILTSVFLSDIGIEIVGTFKEYKETKDFLSNLDYLLDCIIVNFVCYREDVLNILLDIKQYSRNVFLVIKCETKELEPIKGVLDSENIKIIGNSKDLNLGSISHIKEEIVKEVYEIKNSRIRNVLFIKKKAIVIAASTGGPKVLENIFTNLEIDLKIPIFVVQHMPDGYTKQFADRLNEICKYTFCEGRDGEIIKSNMIYIAPSGYHMQIIKNKIMLDKTNFVNSVRPSADVLFCSASKVYKEGLLGIVLTGMGKDASYGIECIKNRNGVTVAQNEKSCDVFGMPKSAIETGKIDKILSIKEIVLEILNHSSKI